MSSGCRGIEVRCKRVGVTLLVELLFTRTVKKPRKGSGWSANKKLRIDNFRIARNSDL